MSQHWGEFVDDVCPIVGIKKAKIFSNPQLSLDEATTEEILKTRRKSEEK